MYDELVKELRNMFRAYKATDNGNCRHAKTILQAADAIEGLVKESERWQVEAKDWYLTYMGLLPTRWIPVTERLPEKSEHYLVHINCGQGGEIMSSWTQVAWFCKKFYWEHLHGEAFEETITHWMPLPQPPKEG